MILLFDNYDSFTFNLWQALAALGAEVEVRRNDAITEDEVARMAPRAIVLSPGPGRPEDAGVTPALVARFLGRLPIFGVCLGHQAIGLVLGARIVRATRQIHGKAEPVHHDGRGLFEGLPRPLLAGRYHSLALDRATLPPELHISAESGDGTVMAIAHRDLPLWGVQFHPESVLTPEGPLLLANFLAGLEGPR